MQFRKSHLRFVRCFSQNKNGLAFSAEYRREDTRSQVMDILIKTTTLTCEIMQHLHYFLQFFNNNTTSIEHLNF